MLTKEECENALDHLIKWVNVDNLDDMGVFRKLIDEHFEHKCKYMTICETLEAISELTQNDEVENMLNYIEERVGAIEDRLLECCNAIERLGFERVGRDYENQ